MGFPQNLDTISLLYPAAQSGQLRGHSRCLLAVAGSVRGADARLPFSIGIKTSVGGGNKQPVNTNVPKNPSLGHLEMYNYL